METFKVMKTPGEILTLLRGAGLRVSQVDGVRYRLACPFPEHGPDRNPSAVAFSDSGHVWCSKCQRKAFAPELAQILGVPWSEPHYPAEPYRARERAPRPVLTPREERTPWRT